MENKAQVGCPQAWPERDGLEVVTLDFVGRGKSRKDFFLTRWRYAFRKWEDILLNQDKGNHGYFAREMNMKVCKAYPIRKLVSSTIKPNSL